MYTFEYHEERANEAKKEFERHDLTSLVTVTHSDVCESGFGLENKADAIFLDLPNPWKAISHAKISLKKDQVSRLCSFSPCMEQVQKTVQELLLNGFKDLEMIELLNKDHIVKTIPISNPISCMNNNEQTTQLMTITKTPSEMKGHTSYLTFAHLYPE